ncbi:hypothetical protein AC579_5937 [Pseudocercospora musae]|uniref:Uncharacterized protein n=1 Tax=Pseudocercospora musae TaxID=113226 RepID=A0A139ITJ6_9PEZI|nr:hypothetical protein AC579_5937 [Pseudocercospora musae]
MAARPGTAMSLLGERKRGKQTHAIPHIHVRQRQRQYCERDVTVSHHLSRGSVNEQVFVRLTLLFHNSTATTLPSAASSDILVLRAINWLVSQPRRHEQPSAFSDLPWSGSWSSRPLLTFTSVVGGAIAATPPPPRTTFRCDVYGTDGSDFINAIEECEQLATEAGGRVTQEYQGGFVYDMQHHRNKNPLDDNEPTERGGFINVSPWEKNKVASYRPPVPPKRRAKSADGTDETKPVRRSRTGNATKTMAGNLFARIKKRVGSARHQQQEDEAVAEQSDDLAIEATERPEDGPIQSAPQQEHAADAASITVSAFTRGPSAPNFDRLSAFTREQSSTNFEQPSTLASPRHCRHFSDEGSERSAHSRGSINSSNYDWESAVIEEAQLAVVVPAGTLRLIDIPPRRQAPRQQ